MAAGAPRHRAPGREWGSTGNVLQAFGVAAGGLCAVAVMTVLAGGPAAPDTVVTAAHASPTVAAPAAAVAARGTQVQARHVVRITAVRDTIWSVPGAARPRPIGPTVPTLPTVPASPQTTVPTVASTPTPTPTPTTRPPRTPAPVVHPPRTTPTPTPTPTPTTPTPTPTDPAPTPTDPPPTTVVPTTPDLPSQLPPAAPVG